MKKNILLVPVLLMLFLVSIPAHAQTIKSDQILAYVSRANVALTNNNWNSALESANEAQKLAGQNIAAFELIRIRSYHGKAEFLTAKRSLDSFYELNPNQSQITEVAPYASMIDDEIQVKKDRIVELENREKEAKQRKENEIADYDQIYATVNVSKQAVLLANRTKIRIANEIRNASSAEMDRVFFDYYPFNTDARIKMNYRLDPFLSLMPDRKNGFLIDIGSVITPFTVDSDFCARWTEDKFTVRYSLTYDIVTSPSDIYAKSELSLNIRRIYITDKYNPFIYGCGSQGRYNSIEQANEKVHDETLEYAESKIKAIYRNPSFKKEESIAYTKNRKEFEWFFFNAFYTSGASSYSQLKNEWDNKQLEEQKKEDANRLAREQRQAEIRAKEEAKRRNEAKLASLKNELDIASSGTDLYVIRRKLIAYKEQKVLMGYSTQNEDSRMDALKEQIRKQEQQLKATFEQYLSEGKSAIEKKQYEYALGILKKAKVLKESNPEIYFGGDYEIEDPIRKAEEELTADQNAVQVSTELVVDDNQNLAYERQILERAISIEPENESFTQKLEQVNLRLKVVPLLKEGDELLEEDKISEAIEVYRSALVIMPNLDVTTNKLQGAQEALSAKSRSKHQLLEEIQTELKNTDGFDDVAKEKARLKVLDYIKDFPGEVELLVAATDLFIQEKLGLEDAFNMTQAVLKVDPENIAALNNLGEIFYLNNQTEESMSAFQQAWNLGDKDNLNTLKRLTQGNYTLYLRTKETGYAQNALKAALYAQNLSLDDPVFSRVTTNLCNTNENLSCNE